jgi:RimJ/RimL family protein N-acetyltransferase
MNYSLLGKRIGLRPTQLSDAEKSAQWLNDPLIKKFIDITKTVTTESRRTFLEQKLQNKNEKNFSLILRNSGDYIGNIYLYNIDWEEKQAEIGIFIGEKDFLGKGYGTDAIELIKKYAFGDLKLSSLNLSTYTENIGAIKCYQKAGFKQTQKKDNLLFFELINNG